jgi:6-phosphofructokinase
MVQHSGGPGKLVALGGIDPVGRIKGTIGILTGGGDVPGLNPAIRAVTIRALHEGYSVVGIRCGWAGLVNLRPEREADNSDHFQILTEEIVDRAGRTGGTFLHTSRTRPSNLPKALVPHHLARKYTEEFNDATPNVLKNLEFLGIDVLIPIGGNGQRRSGNGLLRRLQHMCYAHHRADPQTSDDRRLTRALPRH